MICECCGREKEVLIEIGAVSPKVPTTGRCCVSCCAFILSTLNGRDDNPVTTEWVSIEENQNFVDETGHPISQTDIRIGMKDSTGEVHYFCIYRYGPMPEFAAFEIYAPEDFFRESFDRTEYSFRVFGMQKSDAELLAELIKKLDTAMSNPIIVRKQTNIPDSRHYWESVSLRNRGYVQIESRNGVVHFLIDGKLYSAEDFAEMLSSNEGFLLTYQIRDSLDDIPSRETYYLPVRISDEILLDELEELIQITSSGENFISYQDVSQFFNSFGAIYEKLELYFRSNPPGIGKIAGMKIVHRLEELETDDDMFPKYEIDLIRNLIGEY